MNNIYIYQDNLINLLSLIKYLVLNKIKPCNIKNNKYQMTLLDNLIDLKIKDDKKCIDEIINHCGNKIFNIIVNVYNSSYEDRELLIYYFYLNTIKYRDKTIYHRNIKCINLCINISNYVIRETHKYKGFTRFIELKNNVLYAKINPMNDVLFLLAKHFKKRLNKFNWMIHDTKRGYLAIYNQKSIYYIDEDKLKIDNDYNKDEVMYEDLWKCFYKVIGIKERYNSNLRRNMMPKKYWNYLIELEEIESDLNEKSN